MSDTTGTASQASGPLLHDRLGAAALAPLMGTVSLFWFIATIVLITTIVYFWIDILKYYDE